MKRSMGLQSVVRWLLPKEDHFYDFLEEQARLCHKAAQELSTFRDGRKATEVRDAVQLVEHAADDVVRKMEDALARTFVTPIDREDLHRLSSELDDVTDLTNLAARATSVYGVARPSEAMRGLIDLLVQCTAILSAAVPKLRKHAFGELMDDNRKLREMEKRADVIYRGAISGLFEDAAVDAKELLRQKEVLEDIERAIDHCDNVADVLANLAVKHG